MDRYREGNKITIEPANRTDTVLSVLGSIMDNAKSRKCQRAALGILRDILDSPEQLEAIADGLTVTEIDRVLGTVPMKPKSSTGRHVVDSNRMGGVEWITPTANEVRMWKGWWESIDADGLIALMKTGAGRNGVSEGYRPVRVPGQGLDGVVMEGDMTEASYLRFGRWEFQTPTGGWSEFSMDATPTPRWGTGEALWRPVGWPMPDQVRMDDAEGRARVHGSMLGDGQRKRSTDDS